MASGSLNKVVEHLHRISASLNPDTATDGQLLEGFIGRRDEAAFAALVRRHGPMVLGVCRRVVGDPHDADDAFQATFFVLARRADDIRPRDMVGNWLYGVAYRTALKARSVRERRRAVEKQVQVMPQAPAIEPEVWLDLQPLLDQELNKLPDVYRNPVLLCDVEGRARKDVALQLGVPEGTLSSRLSRGRQMLAKRLGRRGISLSALALAAVLGRQATAAVPPALAASTAKTAALLAAGSGVIPAAVAVLMDAACKSILLNKLTTVASVLLAAVVGVGVVCRGPHTPPAAVPPQPVATALAATPTDEERLQGTWDVVALEADGQSVPLSPEFCGKAVTFEADMLVTRFAPLDEDSRAARTTFKLGSERAPRTIDVHIEGEKKSSGIYQIENGLLTICLAPAKQGRPTEFKTTPEGAAILFVLRLAADRG